MKPNIYYEIVKVTLPVVFRNEELIATLAVGVNVYEPPPWGTTTEDINEDVINVSSSILVNEVYEPNEFEGCVS